MDAAVMPHVRCQRRASPAPRPRLQPGEFHADAGDAEDGRAVVADQPAREADQDRREGRQPRPLRYVSDGRGGGAAADVRRNPVADRATAGTTRAGMRATEQMRQTTPEVRPDAGRATRFSATARSTGVLTACRARGTRFTVAPRRPMGRSSPHNDSESGECRINQFLNGNEMPEI